MSILIDPTGKILTKSSQINEVIFPSQIDNFAISGEEKQFIETKLNEHDAEQLFQFISKDVQAFCQSRQLVPTKAAVVMKQKMKYHQHDSKLAKLPMLTPEMRYIFSLMGVVSCFLIFITSIFP